MATTTLNASTFEQTVKDNEIVLVDFWATWCPPCKMFGPVYEASSEANPQIVHGKVDIDAEPALRDAAGIQAVPTLMAFRDGVAVFSQAGALNGAQLSEVVEAVKGLDMDEVRREVAEQKAQA